MTNNPINYWFRKYLEEKKKNECMTDALRMEYEKGRADAFAEMQKTWSEEDDVMVRDILGWVPAKSRPEYNQRRVDWLKSLKERIGGEQ